MSPVKKYSIEFQHPSDVGGDKGQEEMLDSERIQEGLPVAPR
jgi:hypothetical protein